MNSFRIDLIIILICGICGKKNILIDVKQINAFNGEKTFRHRYLKKILLFVKKLVVTLIIKPRISIYEKDFTVPFFADINCIFRSE